MALGTDLSEKYYVRRYASDEWEDVTEKFVGVKILKIDGFNEKGDAVNIYNEQWMESQAEDFIVTGSSGNIIRKNIDLSLTFICGERYGANDTQECHADFVDWITKHGDFYIKSEYTNKEAHVICTKGYKPTTQKLQRGANNSYVIGTIDLHTLDIPTTSSVKENTLYIGFGGATITSIEQLLNLQNYTSEEISGNYTIVCPQLSYLWVCSLETISEITSNGFEVPMEQAVPFEGYYCYRSSANIKPHTMNFTILT